MRVFFLLLSTLANAFAGDQREKPDVFLPSNYANAQKLPLVLLLHGYSGNAKLIDSYFGLSAKVDRGFILVVPNGLKDSSGLRYWNASDGCCDFDHVSSDDVGYLLDLVEKVKKQYSIDEKKIYVMGHSNGGFMAYRMACDPRISIAGIVSFAGAMPIDTSLCSPAKPVSVLQIHALDDDTIHYQGDPVGYERLKPYPSEPTTVSFWTNKNKCTGKTNLPQRLDLTLSIPGEDTDLTEWIGCAPGSSVKEWTIQAYSSWLHSAHTPFLRDEFSDLILEHIFR